MSDLKFLDTNILLYGYDRTAGVKRDIAMRLMQTGWENVGSRVVSVQVLQEFYVNFVRKKGSESHADAKMIVEDLMLKRMIAHTIRFRFSFGRSYPSKSDTLPQRVAA